MSHVILATASIDLVDIITAECDYGCEAIDYETGTPVYYDEHIYYARAIYIMF